MRIQQLRTMKSERVPGICVADPDADCDNCSLKDRLLCRFEKTFAKKFLLYNDCYYSCLDFYFERRGAGSFYYRG